MTDISCLGDVDVRSLFEHLDRIEQREEPLSSIRCELRRSASYVETDKECPVDGCTGSVWEGVGNDPSICESCSTIYGSTSTTDEPSGPWEQFQAERPRYPNSNRRRQVGGFTYEYDGTIEEGSEDEYRDQL